MGYRVRLRLSVGLGDGIVGVLGLMLVWGGGGGGGLLDWVDLFGVLVRVVEVGVRMRMGVDGG